MKKFYEGCRNVCRFGNSAMELGCQKYQQWAHLFAFAAKYVIQDYVQ
jgi:hypothetical protein